ncbi:MAG TPA: hypothetical protein VFI02_15515 [Armatimonadota bacterium]|nr:hypothetical protein [Armatimonadota bacterium]
MPAGIIARLVGAGVFVLIILGGALYFTHLGAKLEKQELLLKNQARDLEIRAENARKLREALEDQDEATAAAREAAATANALYEEVLNRPRPVRVVPRDQIVEVIRSGNCDTAAVDAWDLLKEKGVIQWNDASNSRDVDYWRDYYLDYARHAPQPRPVQVDIHVSRPLNPGLTELRYPPLGQSSGLSQPLNYGLPISVEIRSPQTVPR